MEQPLTTIFAKGPETPSDNQQSKRFKVRNASHQLETCFSISEGSSIATYGKLR
jgi:hypothetical protein